MTEWFSFDLRQVVNYMMIIMIKNEFMFVFHSAGAQSPHT